MVEQKCLTQATPSAHSSVGVTQQNSLVDSRPGLDCSTGYSRRHHSRTSCFRGRPDLNRHFKLEVEFFQCRVLKWCRLLHQRRSQHPKERKRDLVRERYFRRRVASRVLAPPLPPKNRPFKIGPGVCVCVCVFMPSRVTHTKYLVRNGCQHSPVGRRLPSRWTHLVPQQQHHGDARIDPLNIGVHATLTDYT